MQSTPVLPCLSCKAKLAFPYSRGQPASASLLTAIYSGENSTPNYLAILLWKPPPFYHLIPTPDHQKTPGSDCDFPNTPPQSAAVAGASAHLDATVELVEALGGALAVDEGAITLVHVGSQEVGGVCVGARNEHGGNATDVRRQPRGHQRADELAGRDQHLHGHY